jgi:hypothetical protein
LCLVAGGKSRSLCRDGACCGVAFTECTMTPIGSHEASLRAGEIFPCCKRFEIGKNQISAACPQRLPNG